MNDTGYMTWFAETAAVWALLFVCQIPLRRKKHAVIRSVVFAVKLLLIPLTALLFVAIDTPFSYNHADLLTALYIGLIGDTAASVLEYVIRRIRCNRDTSADRHACITALNGIMSLLLCAGTVFWGMYNVSHVVRREHTFKADGLAREHTFVFAADIHAGSAQPPDTLADMCRQINEAKPEFVILGGDITDEITSYDKMVQTYNILSEIEAPTYFIYGNHDRQPGSDIFGGRTYTDEQLAEAITSAGINILSDGYAKLSDDLFLLGREDMSMGNKRKPWAELEPSPYDGALIVADHQPYDKEQLNSEVSALQLSGHTHAGQLFPLQLVYRILGLPAYGEFGQPGTKLYVSEGAGVWMLPLRTEARCAWEQITLSP